MKSYPSIPHHQGGVGSTIIYAFDKLDGSNIRAEWSKKKGFYKFGTRTRLVDATDPIFGKAPDLVLERYGEVLPQIAKANRWDRAIFFFEFFGPSSFAGVHNQHEEHEVLFIDASVYKKGFLLPSDYMKTFQGIDQAPLLYHGSGDGHFIESVQTNTLEGITNEGVICRYVHKRQPAYFKVKTQKWLSELRAFCGKDDKMFEKMR